MKGKKVISKTETVQEFLARGGKITVVPSHATKEVKEQVRQMAGGPAVILTMDDGELYYGDKTKAPTTPKAKAPAINIDALPDALKRKFLERLNAQTKEEQELGNGDYADDAGDEDDDCDL